LPACSNWSSAGIANSFKDAVIPAKAGIHFDVAFFAISQSRSTWIPAFAGMTAFLEFSFPPVVRVFNKSRPVSSTETRRIGGGW